MTKYYLDYKISKAQMEELKELLELRQCFNCGQIMGFEGYYRDCYLKQISLENAIQIWESEFIEIYCCNCMPGITNKVSINPQKVILGELCMRNGRKKVSYLDYILARNNISRRKLLKEYILECKTLSKDSFLAENIRLAYAFEFSRCCAIFNQIYPFRNKELKEKLL